MEFISDDRIRKEREDDDEEPPTEKVYVVKRPNISLLHSYKHNWKSRHNHFLRYTDVKPKDERRPTVTDLANQKQVVQKINGWKVYHLSTQMEDLVSFNFRCFFILFLLYSTFVIFRRKWSLTYLTDYPQCCRRWIGRCLKN